MKLVINHVSKILTSGTRQGTSSDISMVVVEKQFLVYSGPSGCGKTRLPQDTWSRVFSPPLKEMFASMAKLSRDPAGKVGTYFQH